MGLVVALFILFSAYKAAKETLSPLLGQAPDPALVQQIRDIVLSNDTVLGVHDLVVHDYGPGRLMITLHAEVPAHGDIMAMHDVIDNIEKELMEKLHCHAVIHMDPVDTDDASIARLREQVAELVKQVDPGLTIHDFRVVRGTTHDNLIFDAVLPLLQQQDPRPRQRRRYALWSAPWTANTTPWSRWSTATRTKGQHRTVKAGGAARKNRAPAATDETPYSYSHVCHISGQ